MKAPFAKHFSVKNTIALVQSKALDEKNPTYPFSTRGWASNNPLADLAVAMAEPSGSGT
jgi:hypothetical protein